MEILKWKKLATEMKNSIDGLNKCSDTDGEKISEMADRPERIMQNEPWRDRLKDDTQTVVNKRYNKKISQTERGNEANVVFRENNVKFSKLMTDNKPCCYCC